MAKGAKGAKRAKGTKGAREAKRAKGAKGAKGVRGVKRRMWRRGQRVYDYTKAKTHVDKKNIFMTSGLTVSI